MAFKLLEELVKDCPTLLSDLTELISTRHLGNSSPLNIFVKLHS